MLQQLELSALSTLSAYQKSRENIFPSQGSLDWFIRQNRHELAAKGALLIIAGQKRAHTERFDAAVLEIGSRTAQQKAGI